MVYTDGIHLIADDLEELHQFARHIGLKKCWFHYSGKYLHYDLMKKASSREMMLKRAMDAGAVLKTSKELVKILKNEL